MEKHFSLIYVGRAGCNNEINTADLLHYLSLRHEYVPDAGASTRTCAGHYCIHWSTHKGAGGGDPRER